MWIRSQNKKSLLNVNQAVTIPSVDKSKYYICNSLEKESVTLGVYSTEEKVLKVLDQIQKEVEGERFRTVESMGGKDYISHEMLRVYRMPADEDVIV